MKDPKYQHILNTKEKRHEDVKKETKELINTLQQYTVEQRDQAIKEVDQALKKRDGRIEVLESRFDKNWDKMILAARQEAKANLKALRQQRNELAEWYGSFKNSSVKTSKGTGTVPEPVP